MCIMSEEEVGSDVVEENGAIFLQLAIELYDLDTLSYSYSTRRTVGLSLPVSICTHRLQIFIFIK